MTSVVRTHIDGWAARAACVGERAALFYPPVVSEPRGDRRRREAEAKAICDDCAVRSECLDHAIEHDERYGVWGGLTGRERAALSRPDRASAARESRAGNP